MNGRVGYRFHPTDAELVDHFLREKILGDASLVDDDIHSVDLCKFDPWDLPGFASQGPSDQVWYFFYERELKYKNTCKPRYNRSTKSGHWKPTGAERSVRAKRTNKVIGIKRTLVFYLRGVPREVKTNWVIHEYELKPSPPHQANLVLCKLKEKADDKADPPGREEGESAGNGAPVFESNRIEIPDSEVYQRVLLESIVADRGINFRDPYEHQPQILIDEGLSIDDLMLSDDVFYNDSNGKAIQSDTSDTEEDPNEMADSFIDYEYDNEKHICTISYDQSLSGVFLDDIDDMDTEIVAGRSFQCGASNLNIRQHEEHRQTQRVQTFTETLPPSRYEQSTTAKNHVHRNDVLVMEALSANSIAYPAEEMNFIGLAGSVKQRSSRSGNITGRMELQGDFSSLPDRKVKETRKHVNAVTLPLESRKGSTIVKAEKDEKVVTGKASLKSRTDEMEGNKKIESFIRMEKSLLSQRPNPPAVYIVNVVIGLVLFMAAIIEVLILH